MKEIKLNLKDVSTQGKVNEQKRYFLYEISKKHLFRGVPITFAYQEKSLDECWLKFTAGNIEDNPSRKINLARVARVHWIFIILKLYRSEIFDPTLKYSNVIEHYNPNNTELVEIEINDKNYFLFIKKIGFIDVTSKDFIVTRYILLSAYYNVR